MLEVSDLQINYGSKEVIKGVSFRLERGEMLVLFGANGAGKTTLAKAINMTVPVFAGEIIFDGRPVMEMSRADIAQKISVVAQENETKFPVTVRDFVLSGRFAHGKAFGWETADDIAAADKALDECNLKEYADRLMNELSGGERQRVVLARALAAEAELLLLDEPTANLDLANQIMMLDLAAKKCRQEKRSAIVIMHDLNLAAEFGDKFILLKDGGIYAHGTAEEVLTEENINAVFSVRVLTDHNPVTGKVRITPLY